MAPPSNEFTVILDQDQAKSLLFLNFKPYYIFFPKHNQLVFIWKPDQTEAIPQH